MDIRKDSGFPVIAIDIDDVIAANAQAFVDYSNKKYGTHLTVDDYQEHWGEVWKVAHDEVVKRALEYHESGHVGTYAVIDGARTVLHQLKKRFRLVALTARRNSINKLTREWIDKYYPSIFEDIIFTGFFDSHEKERYALTKGEQAQRIGAQYLIDDQLKHILAASELGVYGLLFGSYRWNQAEFLPHNVTRVSDWQEVLTYFETR